MQIKKIDENKLEILITEQDLEKTSLSPQDFMACKLQNETFFLQILNFASKKLGFSFNNCEILVESFSIPSLKSFIIDITTLPRRLHINRNKKFKMHCYFVAKFYSFQNLCTFCNAIGLNNSASLYHLNNAYYLNIKIRHIREFQKILLNLEEFADDFRTENFINENSSLIIKDNAIKICKDFI